MILVEHTDDKRIKVRMEFTDVHEMGSDFMAFLDAVMESELTLDVFTKIVDHKLSETRNTLK